MNMQDELLYEQAERGREMWLEGLPKEEELPEHIYSQAFYEGLEEALKTSKGPARRKWALGRMAAMFAVMVLGSGAYLGVDAEARASVTAWFRETFPNQVVYRYLGDVPEDAIADYRCAWYPEGLEAVETYGNKNSGIVTYLSPREDFVSFHYGYMHSGAALGLSPDEGETLTVTEVTVNGLPGEMYLESGETEDCFLVWFDKEAQISFTLHGSLSAEDTLTMAESVELGQALAPMTAYRFTWLPEGYAPRVLSWGSHQGHVSCLNGKGGGIDLEYEKLDTAKRQEEFGIEEYVVGFYTEKEPVTLLGEEATLYHDSLQMERTLVWQRDGVGFVLESDEPLETMLRIAAHIKP